ncbi:MAG: hypothetical protein HKP48_11900 [Winogradskyella sp.]|uniref:hypothetical protein n=1 Tax=Winogradskyella sp. TaxID=1883156 RepID=UPI00185894AD|nr:hypothetical protein [Winogradskyella sp.]MBT8244518.1 hypothetical protein [Winogradskyella sp.]NNK23960.1 hypothetical protein [Winogradskyella sp.]
MVQNIIQIIFSNLVGKQTQAVLSSLDYRTNIVPHYDEPSLMTFVNQKYVARIIEVSNGMSVTILFIAFVVAFSDTFKRTFFLY